VSSPLPRRVAQSLDRRAKCRRAMRMSAPTVMLAIPVVAGYVYALKHPTQREGLLVMLAGLLPAIAVGGMALAKEEKRPRPHRADRWRPRLSPTTVAPAS